MEQGNDRKTVAYSMLNLMMRYMEIDQKVQNFGTNVSIYHSEIHIVSAIAEHPGIHIRGLAEQMGVASASISETVRKLEKKELIRKEVSPTNRSRLSLYVTKKGELAHEEHRRYHKILDDMTQEELMEASEEQVAFINEFLSHLLVRLEGFEDRI